ncbi:uncharacterized protein LOC130733199 isoform X2 [Lotus japonicus]|nr:uncharacterized protein LOC130733199 isoform X2 [Lotus japonicus]
MEHHYNPSLYLQVIREVMELSYKQYEVRWIANTIGSYQNEKFDQVLEWLNEVDKFLSEVNHETSDKTLHTNSFWCNNMLSRMRKVRAEHNPNLTFLRVSNVGSSSVNMAPLSLREELYCEITLLIKIHYGAKGTASYLSNQYTFIEEFQEQINEVEQFLAQIKLQLEQRIPVTNSDWYHHKVGEARRLIDKCETAFSLQSQNVGSSSMELLSLHEQLRCEKRSLISLKCADLMAANYISTDHDLKDKFSEELQEAINEVNTFLMAINQELEGKFLEKNFGWYCIKIEEARKLIAKNYPAFGFQSQDMGSSSIHMPTAESKAPVDDVGCTEEQYLTSSLQQIRLEEGISTLMMEQNSNPSLLFLQVMSEGGELVVKQTEERRIADILGIYQRRYQNEKFYELMEWIDEVDRFIGEISPEMSDKRFETDSDWCNNVIARIRKLRAKHGPDLIFPTSSPAMEPLSLREELCCEITSLIKIIFIQSLVSNDLHDLISEVNEFLAEIKKQLEEKIPETNSHWCFNKIVETRTLIAKLEPSFSLQSQDARSSSTELLSLHEELRWEIRSLISVKCSDLLVAQSSPNDDFLDKYKKKLQERINEVNEFLTEINLQLEEKFLDKNSDWYRKKIAETRTLIAKRYSSFPIQDVGYTKDQHQIFLSFRGEDTRFGFTRNLYNALRKEGFNVFMDDDGLQSGDPISEVLMRAIDTSKLSIIVFSKNFADSSWCLDEVDKILECKEKNDQLVWPIFYKVEPTDVRHQKNSYKDAMLKQETRFGADSKKVMKWKLSLSKVCNLKAFHYKENSGYENDFIKLIIKDAKNIRDRL